MTQNCVPYRGFSILKNYLKNQEKLDNFSVRDEDVWICGVPKSGTRWTQEIVWLLMHDLDYEGAKEDLNDRVIFMESDRLCDSDKLTDEQYKDTLGVLRKRCEEGPVAVKTHLPWVMLPKEIQEFKKRPKIIYLVRNPKAVVCSLSHFLKLMFGGEYCTLEDFVNGFIDGTAHYCPYWKHVFQFWERRHEPNVLILRYEEMVKDTPGMIKRIAEFLGKKLTDEQLAKLVDHVSFQSMKNNPSVNNERLVEERRQLGGLEKTEENHFRKGKIDSYKEEMTSEWIERMDKWIEENTKNTDFNVL